MKIIIYTALWLLSHAALGGTDGVLTLTAKRMLAEDDDPHGFVYLRCKSTNITDWVKRVVFLPETTSNTQPIRIEFTTSAQAELKRFMNMDVWTQGANGYGITPSPVGRWLYTSRNHESLPTQVMVELPPEKADLLRKSLSPDQVAGPLQDQTE